MPTTDDFRYELTRQLSMAQARGLNQFDLNAGDLHRFVGDYPGRDHRMPSCCDAMYNAMKAGDRVVAKPLMGKGASLTIRYQLPR